MNRRRFLTVAAGAAVAAVTATGAKACDPVPSKSHRDERVYQCSCGRVFYGRAALDAHLAKNPTHIAKRVR